MPRSGAPTITEFDGKDFLGKGLVTLFSGEYEFLSNFHAEAFDCAGKLVPTAEHAYQAQKTLDPQARAAILFARSPGEAKRIGRAAPMRPGWNELRVQVMREVLRWKFASANFERELPMLSAHLMATGDKHLVEGNTWGDRFWGCVNESGNLWVGANTLGILLMERRTQLQKEIPY